MLKGTRRACGPVEAGVPVLEAAWGRLREGRRDYPGVWIWLGVSSRSSQGAG
jgi:hypothetical protein